jgi:hypothetical protein
MLSWRVPTSGDPRLLRLAIAQIGLASVIAGLLLFVALPREWLIPGLVGLIPLAIYMAYRRWSSYRRSLAGEENVWLDEEGLHWLDTAGEKQSFARPDVLGFHIGRHLDTLRAVPALTLKLSSGFESQPIELHPPATAEAVRDVLTEAWQIEEHEDATVPGAGDYDAAVSIYGECHEEFQEWHWEGTKTELGRFFEMFRSAAEELPLPPAGAQPASRVILLSRRQPTRLRIAHSPVSHLEPGIIAAPGVILREITSHATAAINASLSTADLKFHVGLGPKSTWTFHLHVRPA